MPRLSQMQLATAVQVQRSAVSHWESSQSRNPSVTHLRAIAMVTGVQFEWLVTGRGAMVLCNEVRMDSVPTADALLVEEPIELRWCMPSAMRHRNRGYRWWKSSNNWRCNARGVRATAPRAPRRRRAPREPGETVAG